MLRPVTRILVLPIRDKAIRSSPAGRDAPRQALTAASFHSGYSRLTAELEPDKRAGNPE